MGHGNFTLSPIKSQRTNALTQIYLIPTSSAHAAIYTTFKGTKLANFNTYLLDNRLPSHVDFGASLFPKEVFNVPPFWARARVANNIVFWKEHLHGGHFPSVERPEVLVGDIRDFTLKIGKGRMLGLRAAGRGL